MSVKFAQADGQMEMQQFVKCVSSSDNLVHTCVVITSVIWFSIMSSLWQVKLVRVAGQEGEQVYIQIGDEEMEMLTQQQAEQVRLMPLDSCNSDENTC